jgi:chromosome segregation ATPase
MNSINKQPFRRGAAACFAAWLALGALPAVAAGMYKWTDDQGMVHYSDQMPADAVNKGGVVFDKQGRQIKKIDATLTPAQAKAKEAEDERQRLLAKVQEDKSRRDTALTHSYTSEEEIDFARSRALLAVESQLKAAETYVADLTKRQQELRKDKLAYGTKPVPATLDNELTGLDEELARQDKVLAQRRTEISTINAKYESDKQRWREIRTDQGKPPAPAAAGTPPAPPSKSATSTVTK